MRPVNLLRQIRQHARSVLLVHLLFSLLGFALLTPAFTLLLRGLLALSGNRAVTDQDIALLLLSPLGMGSLVLLAGAVLAIIALELGALLAMAVAAGQGRALPARDAVAGALGRAPAILHLGMLLFLRVLLYLLPYAAAVAALAWFFLGDHDINYYLSQRPPAFYYALAGAVPLTLLLLWILGKRLLRWSLALPLVLFDGARPLAAFGRSEAMCRGHAKPMLRDLAGWVLLSVSALLVPTLVLDLSAGAILGLGVQRLSVLIPLLGTLVVVWTILNFIAAAMVLGGLSLVLAHWYRILGPVTTPAQAMAAATAHRLTGKRLASRQMAAALVVAALVAGTTGWWLFRQITPDDDVLVVAHRGAAGAAPENTLASVRQAVADGADWVEIDVQETSDGAVVVVHDSDFMKLAGNPLKVWEGELARVREIDVGSWFSAEFAGEQVPTLHEVLEAVRGRSRLVIELKYYGHDQRLEQRVVEQVEAAGMAGDVAVMSLKLDGVRKLKALRPEWTVGLLAATAVGDLTRLDVDFLAVNANMANARFIRRAHAAGKQVFVWTINDAVSLSSWMSRGVDGVITDEPALARQVLAERDAMNSAQRLLLQAALFFGKPPPVRNYRDDSP
jgi:glycerophosphoryl diester phosphodiesterase